MPTLRLTRSFPGPGVAVLAAALALPFVTPASAETPGWPRQFDSPSGSFVVYQPQPEDLNGDVLTGRAAFSLQKDDNSNPTFGVLWFTEQIAIDRDSSTVTARDLDVTKVRLPRITAAEASRYEELVEAEAARWDLTGSLDELKAGLAAAEKERASVADLDNTPPRIIFSHQRSILVVYDGAPAVEPIEGSNLERVVNTPYAVVYDPTSSQYYLSGANVWYSTSDPRGPWRYLPQPPAEVEAVVPPDTSANDQVQGPPPKVLTAIEPTELISIDGEPRYAPLVGDQLLYVTNTESDVVREVDTQALYVLLSGRWYRGESEEGPWRFVRGDQLPASFAQVPLDSPKGNILASVAGTDQAGDAVADAEIPQTSAVRRDDTSFNVSYDGTAQFERIQGTDLEYAVNTDAEVLLADGRYYACDQGVWYVADGPDGPWMVSETRPIGVDDIPPSCPVYNVRYVYVYDSTPSVIYVGYLPGYLGYYPYYGTVYYGTGYHYRPWRGRHHFYPRFCTWGFHARYNPWLSRWSFGLSYTSGFLRTGYRWRSGFGEGPRRSPPLWFGPGGFRRPLMDRDVTLVRAGRPRLRVPDRMPMNLYNRTENSKRVDRVAVRTIARVVMRPTPRPTPVPNDLFAGKDGKVYQRDDKGNWKVNEGRGWKSTRVPSTPPVITPPWSGENQGGRASGAVRPGVRPEPRPTPVREPAQRPPQWGGAPRPRPAPPTISPTPGNLEREFRARQRASEGVVARPPQPAPRVEQPKREPARREEPRNDNKRNKDNKDKSERRR